MGTPTLAECVAIAVANPEFVENWARLRGISLPSTPIDRMVDDATGRSDAIASQFIQDVADLLFDRIGKEDR